MCEAPVAAVPLAVSHADYMATLLRVADLIGARLCEAQQCRELQRLEYSHAFWHGHVAARRRPVAGNGGTANKKPLPVARKGLK